MSADIISQCYLITRTVSDPLNPGSHDPAAINKPFSEIVLFWYGNMVTPGETAASGVEVGQSLCASWHRGLSCLLATTRHGVMIDERRKST